MGKCTFCQNDDEVHETDNPDLRLCSTCREKLGTHIAVVCTNCDTLYWLQKTPQNAAIAADMSGLPVDHIMDNYMVHQIETCKRCFHVLEGLVHESKWVN